VSAATAVIQQDRQKAGEEGQRGEYQPNEPEQRGTRARHSAIVCPADADLE
jgi:hypothetical protein